jgi:two-component system, chemotaxis family, protein-glutamate methylesterase/glutaminase
MRRALSIRSARDSALVVIGASTGGVRALCELFDHLPALPAAVLIVQHMPAYIQPSFVRSLGQHTPMPVDLARDGAMLAPGSVLLAPAGVHCAIERNRVIRLVGGPHVNFVCPAIDVTMRSVEPSSAPLLGVLLTGMGRDGAAGMVHLKNLGARTVAQNEASCAVFGMPKEAWNTGGVDHLLPPEGIARWICQQLCAADAPARRPAAALLFATGANYAR